MRYELLLVPLLTIITGWATGWLLVRMLLQREWPRFLSGEEGGSLFASLESRFTDPAAFGQLQPFIEAEVDVFLRVKLPQRMPMIGMLVGERTINEMKQVFLEELRELFPVVMKNYMSGLQNKDLLTEMFQVPFNKLAARAAYKARMVGAAIGLGMGIVQSIILFWA